MSAWSGYTATTDAAGDAAGRIRAPGTRLPSRLAALGPERRPRHSRVRR